MRQLEQLRLPPSLSPWLGWLLLLLFLAWSPRADSQTADHGTTKPKRYQDLANDFLVKGDYDNCISNCLKAIHQNPRDAWAYDIRALARGDKGDLDGAIADFRSALRLDPNYANAYANCGWFFLYKKHDLRVALADYNEAIRLDPTNVDDYFSRAQAYLEQTNFNLALNDFNTAIQLNPANAAGFYRRGELFCTMTNYAGAIADFTQCIQLEPTNDLYYEMRAGEEEEIAKAFGKLGEVSKHQEALNHALGDHQQAATLNPEALGGLGRFECRQGHFDQGIADFTLRLQTCPTDYSGLDYRAYAYEIAGNRMGTQGDVKGQQDALAKALADWNQLVALKNQEESEFLCRRGEYYFRNHQYTNALSDFHQAMELQTNSYEAETSLAEFLATCPDPAFRDGTNAIAIAQLASSSAHFEHGVSLAALAAAYAETGDFAQAVKWQNQALVEMETEGGYIDSFRAQMRDRLTLYEKGQPCHQPVSIDLHFE